MGVEPTLEPMVRVFNNKTFHDLEFVLHSIPLLPLLSPAIPASSTCLLPSPTKIVYHSLPNKSSKDIIKLDWRQVGVMGTLQLFPIFPTLKDIIEI